MSKLSRLLWWLFPIDRVRYKLISKELKEQRYYERVDRVVIFAKHKVKPLISQACILVVENQYGGPYRTIWHLLRTQVRDDIQHIYWIWKWRIQARWLIHKGMTKDEAQKYIEENI